jgi:hypothetical protein
MLEELGRMLSRTSKRPVKWLPRNWRARQSDRSGWKRWDEPGTISQRTLSNDERTRLEAGPRSKDAFVLRRSQMLLASSKANEVPQIAERA